MLNEENNISFQGIKLFLRILYLNIDQINFKELIATISDSHNLLAKMGRTDVDILWQGLWTIFAKDPDHFTMGKFYIYFSFYLKLTNLYDDRTYYAKTQFYNYFKKFYKKDPALFTLH